MPQLKQITVQDFIKLPHYTYWSDSRIKRRVLIKNKKLSVSSASGVHLLEPVTRATDARLDVILGRVGNKGGYQVIDGNSRKWVATQCIACDIPTMFGDYKLNALYIDFESEADLIARFNQHDNKNSVDIASDVIAYGLNQVELDDNHLVFGLAGMASALKLVGKSANHLESIEALSEELKLLQSIPYNPEILRRDNKGLLRSSVKAAMLELLHYAVASKDKEAVNCVKTVIKMYLNADIQFKELQANLRGSYYKGQHWATINRIVSDKLKEAHIKVFGISAPSKPIKAK